jgi:hypothetical protein
MLAEYPGVLGTQARLRLAQGRPEDALAAMGGCGMFRGAFVRLAHAEQIPEPAYRRSFLEQVPENARTLELARAWHGEALGA